METLGDIMRRQAAAKAREEGLSRPLSNREIARRGGMHHSAIARYMNNELEGVTGTRLKDVAAVLATDDVGATELLKQFQRALGAGTGGWGLEWDFPVEVFDLTPPERTQIEDLIRTIVRNKHTPVAPANGAEGDDDASRPEE